MKVRALLILFAALLCWAEPVRASGAGSADWTIRDGKLHVDGRWVFLKIGKPLRNFADAAACQKLADTLDILQAKGFNALELNCYWHHFDKDADGTIDVSLEPLARLVDAIHAKGMFPCLSVETYGVGGGKIPQPFWDRHPEAIAINAEGKEARDLEYGFKTAVPSILHPGYREAARSFIRNLVAGVPHKKILFYETTVEPQFMGHQDLDYSPSAKQAYEAWLAKQAIDGPAWPEKFPVPGKFRTDPVWLRFKAESLADWVNGDAAAFRDVAGEDAYIAVDYLETCNATMPRRNGDSIRFLEALTCADIIQVNWHWRTDARGPNECAYKNVWDVNKRLGRNWAISEHMTLNGSDYQPADVPAMLRNTLAKGTGFGWDFVNVAAATGAKFALYNDDWSPKPLMAEVDDHWQEWLAEIAARPAADARPAKRPNILFIFSDDHAQHALSCYGSKVNSTPHLDRLANEGARFTNSFVTNSICTPSRATLLTGQYSHANGVPVFNAFDGSRDHVAKRLQQAGYHTGMVGKWHLGTDPTGFDRWIVLPGQGAYQNPSFLVPGGVVSIDGHCTDITTDLGIEFLDTRPRDKPFFLMLHHKAPHREWEPDKRNKAKFKDKVFPEPVTLFDDYATRPTALPSNRQTIAHDLTNRDLKRDPPAGLEGKERQKWLGTKLEAVDVDGKTLTGKDAVRWKYQRFMQDYLACVQGVDDSVGRILDYLDRSGLADDTIVIYTTDNGWYLGDLGLYDKRFMYEPGLRVPLLARGPGIEAGIAPDDFVANIDLAPTFLDLAGLPVSESMHGRSLVPLLRGETPADWRTSVYYRYYHDPGDHNTRAHYGVRTATHKLIHYFKQGSYELFDLVADPHEQRNLLFDEAEAKTPEVAAVFESLKAEVARLQREYGDDGRYADPATWPPGTVNGPFPGRQPLGAKSVAEAIALSAAAPAPSARKEAASGVARRKPNFIYVFTDDQRWDALGVVQREQAEKGRFPWLQTPNLDRLAAEGVRFRNAFVVNSLCSPSRASLVTGQYGHVNGVVNNQSPHPEGNLSLPSLLRPAGYASGFVGKWHHGNQSGKRPGFDYSASFRGQGDFFDCPFEVNGEVTPTQGFVDDVTTDYAEGFVREHKDQPFLLIVGYKTCHQPHTPPPRHEKTYDGEEARRVPNLGVRAAYRPADTKPAAKSSPSPTVPTNLGIFRGITAIDDNVGRLLRLLDELHLTEDTVVCFSSDSRFYFGEHGLGDKRSAYEESMRIPMLVRYPRLVAPGRTDDRIVLNVDPAPTFLDLAGVPVPAEMHGRSWRPLLEGRADAAWRDSFFYCYFFENGNSTPTTTAVRTQTAKLIKYPGHDAWTEMFDLRNDPYETRNLFNDPRHAGLRKSLEAEYVRQSKAIDFRIPDFAHKPPADGSLPGPKKAKSHAKAAMADER